jgi:RNA polymerase sigma factor (TIGR02999 family)
VIFFAAQMNSLIVAVWVPLSRKKVPAPREANITGLLLKWTQGDESALAELIPLVYRELHRLARQNLRREHGGHTIQTTTLVHEAYLRLIDAGRVQWHDRAHFFAIAAQLMRRVLVDEARRRHSQKRGGNARRLSLDNAVAAGGNRDLELLELDRALDRLTEFAPRMRQVVELRFFGGLNIEETAAALHISPDTVKRDWRSAKLWLLNEMTGTQTELR